MGKRVGKSASTATDIKKHYRRKLIIAAGTRDDLRLRSAIDGWLVPLLVHRFLQTCPPVDAKSKVIRPGRTSRRIVRRRGF
jgi:hypothetical protein